MSEQQNRPGRNEDLMFALDGRTPWDIPVVTAELVADYPRATVIRTESSNSDDNGGNHRQRNKGAANPPRWRRGISRVWKLVRRVSIRTRSTAESSLSSQASVVTAEVHRRHDGGSVAPAPPLLQRQDRSQNAAIEVTPSSSLQQDVTTTSATTASVTSSSSALVPSAESSWVPEQEDESSTRSSSGEQQLLQVLSSRTPAATPRSPFVTEDHHDYDDRTRTLSQREEGRAQSGAEGEDDNTWLRDNQQILMRTPITVEQRLQLLRANHRRRPEPPRQHQEQLPEATPVTRQPRNRDGDDEDCTTGPASVSSCQETVPGEEQGSSAPQHSSASVSLAIRNNRRRRTEDDQDGAVQHGAVRVPGWLSEEDEDSTTLSTSGRQEESQGNDIVSGETSWRREQVDARIAAWRANESMKLETEKVQRDNAILELTTSPPQTKRKSLILERTNDVKPLVRWDKNCRPTTAPRNLEREFVDPKVAKHMLIPLLLRLAEFAMLPRREPLVNSKRGFTRRQLASTPFVFTAPDPDGTRMGSSEDNESEEEEEEDEEVEEEHGRADVDQDNEWVLLEPDAEPTSLVETDFTPHLQEPTPRESAPRDSARSNPSESAAAVAAASRAAQAAAAASRAAAAASEAALAAANAARAIADAVLNTNDNAPHAFSGAVSEPDDEFMLVPEVVVFRSDEGSVGSGVSSVTTPFVGLGESREGGAEVLATTLEETHPDQAQAGYADRDDLNQSSRGDMESVHGVTMLGGVDLSFDVEEESAAGHVVDEEAQSQLERELDIDSTIQTWESGRQAELEAATASGEVISADGTIDAESLSRCDCELNIDAKTDTITKKPSTPVDGGTIRLQVDATTPAGQPTPEGSWSTDLSLKELMHPNGKGLKANWSKQILDAVPKFLGYDISDEALVRMVERLVDQSNLTKRVPLVNTTGQHIDSAQFLALCKEAGERPGGDPHVVCLRLYNYITGQRRNLLVLYKGMEHASPKQGSIGSGSTVGIPDVLIEQDRAIWIALDNALADVSKTPRREWPQLDAPSEIGTAVAKPPVQQRVTETPSAPDVPLPSEASPTITSPEQPANAVSTAVTTVQPAQTVLFPSDVPNGDRTSIKCAHFDEQGLDAIPLDRHYTSTAQANETSSSSDLIPGPCVSFSGTTDFLGGARLGKRSLSQTCSGQNQQAHDWSDVRWSVFESIMRFKRDQKLILLDYLLADLGWAVNRDVVVGTLKILSDYDVIVYYDDPRLSEFIVLSPAWVENVVQELTDIDRLKALVCSRCFCDSANPLISGISCCSLLTDCDIARLCDSVDHVREVSGSLSRLPVLNATETSQSVYRFVKQRLAYEGVLKQIDVDGPDGPLYFVPRMLEDLEDSQNTAWTFKSPRSYETTLGHKWVMLSSPPVGLVEDIIAAVLQQLPQIEKNGPPGAPHLRRAQTENLAQTTPLQRRVRSETAPEMENVVDETFRVHQIQCWKSALCFKICTVTHFASGAEKVKLSAEIFVALVDKRSNYCFASEEMPDNAKSLVVSARGQTGSLGRRIWEGGYQIILDTVQSVISKRGVNSIVRAACPECLAHLDPPSVRTWDWHNVQAAGEDTESKCLCPHGHRVDMKLVSGKQEERHSSPPIHVPDDLPSLSPIVQVQEMVPGVVLIRAHDKKTGKGTLGSGFVIDSKLGLIVTATHVLYDIDNGSEQFGNLYLPNADLFIGIIPEGGQQADYRYKAEIVAKDVCNIDACVLRISRNVHGDIINPANEALRALTMSRSIQLDEPIRMMGINQGGEGLFEKTHVNHILDFAKGYICGWTPAPSRQNRRNLSSGRSFMPNLEIIAMCHTIGGHSGGPCVNDQGKVVGIVSRADRVNPERLYMVPSSEIDSLVRQAVNPDYVFT